MMSKEKQIDSGDYKNCNSHIEEMAVIMREAYLKECIHPDCHNCEMYNHDDRLNGLCKEKYRAEALYNAGYRKQSEVVREFAEEIKLEFYREFDEIIPSIMADKIDDLVKKYTEDEK